MDISSQFIYLIMDVTLMEISYIVGTYAFTWGILQISSLVYIPIMLEEIY